MKKKLVAFAVTAAMVITSAVPVFAWTAVGSDINLNANAVVADANNAEKGIRNTDSDVVGSIQAGKEFKTYVDFNRTTGAFDYVLNMASTTENTLTDEVRVVLSQQADGKYDVLVKSDNATAMAAEDVQGIVEFTWTFTGDGYFDLTVDELGNTARPETVKDIKVPAGVDKITSLDIVTSEKTEEITGGTIVIYQDKAPVDIVAAEIVECDENYNELTWHGNVIVADQPVKGGYYKVNSITLDDGTVITGDDILKYADVEWKATKANGTVVYTNGTTENKKGSLTWMIEASDKYDGCFITCEISAKANTGVFDTVTVWESAEAIAVQARVFGDDRYATAMEVADQMKPATGFTKFFIATGTDYADALSATALAAKENAPILLVNGEHEADVINYINENAAGFSKTTIYIVGGTSAVSASFEKELYKYAVDVERLAGDTRYDTNISILKEYDKATRNSFADLLVASGTNYPDALSASATGLPILLVGDEVTNAQKDYLQTLAPVGDGNVVNYLISKMTIIGGTAAVNSDVKAELSRPAYIKSADSVTRLWGDDRYETNRAVVNAYNTDKNTDKYAFVAYGMDYADALTGGVLAAKEECSLVLVDDNHTGIASYIISTIAKDNANYGGLVIIGGENAVSNATAQKIA